MNCKDDEELKQVIATICKSNAYLIGFFLYSTCLPAHQFAVTFAESVTSSVTPPQAGREWCVPSAMIIQ